MPVFFYILKLSVCLISVWLFYQLVLRRLTFYTWNRWYLVVCTALAFLLPLVNVAPVLEKNNWTKTPLVSAIPHIAGYDNINAVITPAPTFAERLLSWLPWFIAFGAVAMLVRLTVQYISLLAMRRSSQLILNGPVKVYQVNKPVIPFSFGKAIYINQHLHEEEELTEIIRHEFIHVKQKHTIDIIWSEIICILTWYNPFSWLLRKAIRQNLEFIADQQVLKTGLDRRQYQYLLLKVIGVPTYSIASNFNFKSLKKRIAMMNKGKTARLHLVRFLLLVPVLAIILVAFRNVTKQRPFAAVNNLVTDTVPAKKFPDNVRSFHTINNQVTVTLKNGKTESYNLDNEQEREAFESKYGKLPESPKPPMPPSAVIEVPAGPPPHPAPPAVEEVPAHPYAYAEPPAVVEIPAPPPGHTRASAPHGVAAPHPPTPPHDRVWVDGAEVPFDNDDDCYNEKGYCLSVLHTPKGEIVMILHKGKKAPEMVYLDDWRKDKKYEEKYGKLPPPPPPPARIPPPPAEHLPGGTSLVPAQKFERFSATQPVVSKIHGFAATGVSAQPQLVNTLSTSHGDFAATAPVYNVVANGEVELVAVIKNTTSAEELDKIVTDLKVQGYTLTLLEVKRQNGKIVLIDGKLNFDKHVNHFRTDDFDAILISRTQKTKGSLQVEIRVNRNKQEQ